MTLQEWNSLCQKAWENDCEYLQIDMFAKIGECRYAIRSFKKCKYIECTPETKSFYILNINMIY